MGLYKHGLCKSSIYNIWFLMKRRCENKKTPDYKYYGARGIKVCDRWHNIENFYADMGNPPKGHSLDRINNNGDYSPDNCRWSSRLEQMSNTRINRFLTYNGKTLTINQWARELGMKRSTFSSRINKLKWPLEKIFSIPTLTNNTKHHYLGGSFHGS